MKNDITMAYYSIILYNLQLKIFFLENRMEIKNIKIEEHIALISAASGALTLARNSAIPLPYKIGLMIVGYIGKRVVAYIAKKKVEECVDTVYQMATEPTKEDNSEYQPLPKYDVQAEVDKALNKALLRSKL